MYYRQGWLNKLERKLGWLAIKNLMMIVVGAMAIIWIMDIAISGYTGFPLSINLMFFRSSVLSGEVWRVITFLFLPPYSGNIFFTIIALFFYYSIGAQLEAQWGSFGFTLYYLTGVIGAIAAGFITGVATNDYLNLTMFLAYAILFPRNEFRLFFLIPIEARWLALADAILLTVMFINSTWAGRVSLLFALANLLIFFTPHLIDHIKGLYRKWKWNRNFKK